MPGGCDRFAKHFRQYLPWNGLQEHLVERDVFTEEMERVTEENGPSRHDMSEEKGLFCPVEKQKPRQRWHESREHSSASSVSC